MSDVENPVPVGRQSGTLGTCLPCILVFKAQFDSPTGWSIQMVSAKLFQLNLLNTQEPLGCTWIGPFYGAYPSVSKALINRRSSYLRCQCNHTG